MSKIKYAFCAGLVLLSCVLSLAIPALAAAWQEKLLMQKPSAREVLQEIISEEARKIPIAYALHKRKLIDSFYTGTDYEYTPKVQQEVLSVLSGLKDVGIMPQEIYDEIYAAFRSPKAEFYCRRDKMGFDEISINLTEKEGENTIKIDTQLVLQWHSDTGLATNLRCKAAKLDNDAALDAYKKYLGVDVLPDWHSINENGALYSDMGQLYLLCKQSENTVQFTIAPVSRDEILNK